MQELELPDRWAETVREAATSRKMIGAAPADGRATMDPEGRATMDLDELYDNEIGTGKKRKTKKPRKKKQTKAQDTVETVK